MLFPVLVHCCRKHYRNGFVRADVSGEVGCVIVVLLLLLQVAQVLVIVLLLLLKLVRVQVHREKWGVSGISFAFNDGSGG